MRVLWKYINRHTRDVHFSWERWSRREDFWEFRLPPEEKKVAQTPKQAVE
jgi:hypothetical protein